MVIHSRATLTPALGIPIGAAFCTLFLAQQLFGRVAWGPALIAPFLAERRCPSCAYDLSATNPDPDLLTTCPECGAAWRLKAAHS